MSEINSIAGSILQAPAAARQQEAQKTAQVRSARDRQKNSAASDEEEVEESVTSADELQPIGDDQQHHQQQRKGTYSRHPSTEPEPSADQKHLDLEA
ncbi:MAG TPA: hypothetical protein VGG44_10380 [Tepidisphaeraceae bacterium]|jgi:hypothetical protein